MLEVWEAVRDFPNYICSSEGRVMNVRTQRILSQTVDDKGYARVTLRKNNKQYNMRVHRIIADAFLDGDPELDVIHKNLDRSKNEASNLERRSRSEIISSAYERGTKKPNGATRVLIVETGEIFESINECARALNCNRYSIIKCLGGKIERVRGVHIRVV